MTWDDMAATWDDDPVVRLYSDAALGSLVDRLAAGGVALDGLRALDFGCGTGLLSVAMAEAGAEVVGFDISPAMVAVLAAKGHPRVAGVSGSLSEVDGTFDLVTCSSVCAFVPDYAATVEELVARLRPGGWFVQWDWELNPADDEPYGLTREGIRVALDAAGLTDIEVGVGFEVPYEAHTLAPLMGVGRRA